MSPQRVLDITKHIDDDSCIIRTAFLKHPDKILVTRGQDS